MSFFKKFSKKAGKIFDSKNYVLFFINKNVEEGLGKAVDISIDKEDRTIFLKLQRSDQKASLTIENYRTVYSLNKLYIEFDRLLKDGYLKNELKNISAAKKIEVGSSYIDIFKRVKK